MQVIAKVTIDVAVEVDDKFQALDVPWGVVPDVPNEMYEELLDTCDKAIDEQNHWLSGLTREIYTVESMTGNTLAEL